MRLHSASSWIQSRDFGLIVALALVGLSAGPGATVAQELVNQTVLVSDFPYCSEDGTCIHQTWMGDAYLPRDFSVEMFHVSSDGHVWDTLRREGYLIAKVGKFRASNGSGALELIYYLREGAVDLRVDGTYVGGAEVGGPGEWTSIAAEFHQDTYEIVFYRDYEQVSQAAVQYWPSIEEAGDWRFDVQVPSPQAASLVSQYPPELDVRILPGRISEQVAMGHDVGFRGSWLGADEDVSPTAANEIARAFSGAAEAIGGLFRSRVEDTPNVGDIVYQVGVFTGSGGDGGTDADVWLFIQGTRGSLGWVEMSSRVSGNAFEAGTYDALTVYGPDIGNVQWVCINNAGGGIGPSWRVDYVAVNGVEFPFYEDIPSGATHISDNAPMSVDCP